MARRGSSLFKRNDGLCALKIERDGGIEPATIEIVAKDGTVRPGRRGGRGAYRDDRHYRRLGVAEPSWCDMTISRRRKPSLAAALKQARQAVKGAGGSSARLGSERIGEAATRASGRTTHRRAIPCDARAHSPTHERAVRPDRPCFVCGIRAPSSCAYAKPMFLR
jgi:hypothetical protein